MKVTAIVGSPRRKGQSARLGEEIIRGARESGAETSIHYLGEKHIKPCLGCYTCERTKECIIQDDDMQGIYADMSSSDAYVFASPVYFNQVSGQFKTFLDRIFPYYWGKPLKGRKAVYAMVYEDSDSSLYDEVTDWFVKMVDTCHGINVIDTIKVHAVNKNPVSENEDLLTNARAIGQSLVS